MRLDSPRCEEINLSAHGQDGLRELASHLPDADPFHAWANVEFIGTVDYSVDLRAIGRIVDIIASADDHGDL